MSDFEITFNAANKVTGLTLDELSKAIDLVIQARPGAKFRLKASNGFKGQIQKLTFVEVTDEDIQKA